MGGGRREGGLAFGREVGGGRCMKEVMSIGNGGILIYSRYESLCSYRYS